MSQLQTPFRYDYVGSFLRPAKLKKARRQFDEGNISYDELKKVEDEAITELITKIKESGYHVITDGSNLNVRSGPGTNYSIIGKFKNGQVIDVSFMQDAGIGSWIYAGGVDAITGKYINGYIHEDYYG